MQSSEDTEKMWRHQSLLASHSGFRRLEGPFTEVASHGLSLVSKRREIFVLSRALSVCMFGKGGI